MKDLLRVKNLNKSYKNFSLTDVSFSLSEGCITGFIGINGAGKTTTLRTILDLAKKDSGNIQFFGLDMDKNEQQIKNRIGVVLDDGCFYEELSMAEMKSILASAYTDWSEQDFKHYMDMFFLDPKRKIHTLSKGMKMKYALTLALSHNAELLIMDEPTSGLDPLSRSQLLNVLNDYMENGGKGVRIYLPIQYKLGYEKTKFAFTVVIIASPFLLPQLMKMENFNLNFLSEFSPILICGSVLLLSCMILAVSAALSIKFYNRTDLA